MVSRNEERLSWEMTWVGVSGCAGGTGECWEAYPCVGEPLPVGLYPRVGNVPGLVLGSLGDVAGGVPLGPHVLAHVQDLDLFRRAVEAWSV